jgi:Zn-dependent protease
VSEIHDAPQHPTMPDGLSLGAPFGIKLRLHWSFVLLGGWLMFSEYQRTGSFEVVAHMVVIATVVFGSVALHEYGHALTARRYGIRTREIVLLPIGGIAQLERSPENPRQEFWISLAGPAVNVVLAGLAFGAASLFDSGRDPLDQGLGGSLLGVAVNVNLFMGIFNLIPAMPMDGGRVLRALLSLRMPALRATRIATTVAQVLAGGMMAYGVVGGRLMLAVIGGFVWIAARAELRRAEFEAALLERARRMAGRPIDVTPGFFGADALPTDPPDPGSGIRVVGSGSTRRR